MDEALSRLIAEDHKHAAQTGELNFIRAAEEPEIALFKMIAGEPAGFGPRRLLVIIGESRRLFVSWPRDLPIPKHTEADLRALLAEATAREKATVVLDPSRRN